MKWCAWMSGDRLELKPLPWVQSLGPDVKCFPLCRSHAFSKGCPHSWALNLCCLSGEVWTKSMPTELLRKDFASFSNLVLWQFQACIEMDPDYCLHLSSFYLLSLPSTATPPPCLFPRFVIFFISFVTLFNLSRDVYVTILLGLCIATWWNHQWAHNWRQWHPPFFTEFNSRK